MQALELPRAVAAARSTASALDLTVDDAIVLRDANRLVLRLMPCDVVARAAYAGDLVDGTYYEWAEAPREDLRRRAVDAAARLAELHQQTGDPNAALAALDHAVTNDPYTEELYRRTMRIQAGLSRPDAVRRTYRLLETRLADLDVEPDDTTDRLLHKLLGRESSTEPRTMTAAAGGCQ
jgi:DNA-binding SARP family transcriptional activator